MSIHFISGKPRGGKSLYAVKLVVDELLYGSRCVITNLALRPGDLNAYLQVQHPDRSINLFDRLIILTDDETGVFWTVRPHGVRVPLLAEADWRAGRRPDYSAVKDAGVFYAIDEVHNFFNSRKWMETGRDVLFYLSQHGKLGDTVICITQHVANVDKQFRSVTQDYTYLRNMCKERMGLFKLPALFMRKTYLQPATDTSAPMETGSFRLDVSGLASCYDTAKGVGIHGRSADKSERAKGLHWMWFVIGVPLLIWLGLRYVPRGVAAVITPKGPIAAITAPAVPGLSPAVPATNAAPSGLPVPAPGGLASSVHSVSTNELSVTGVATMGSVIYVTLSDGRILNSARGDIVSLSSDGVRIRGETGFVKIPRGRF